MRLFPISAFVMLLASGAFGYPPEHGPIPEIKGAELRIANELHPGLPKWIWYTHEPNHKATTQLTDEQKERLWNEHGPDIH